jgi:hypothetical protein
MIWIDHNDNPELQRAWKELGDPVMESRGEHWQYVGSWDRGDGWKHVFRHRCHPATDQPATINVPASQGWPQPA